MSNLSAQQMIQQMINTEGSKWSGVLICTMDENKVANLQVIGFDTHKLAFVKLLIDTFVQKCMEIEMKRSSQEKPNKEPAN